MVQKTIQGCRHLIKLDKIDIESILKYCNVFALNNL